MHWTCGQCHLLCMWEICSKIVIEMSIQDMWSVFFFLYMWVVCSKRVIGLSILYMWSVFCVS